MPANTRDIVRQRHLQILDFYLQGKTGSEIARTLNMTECSVSIIINSPSFQHELALRRASLAEKIDDALVDKTVNSTDPVLEKLKSSALKAAERLALNLQDQNGTIANKAAEAILNRAGYGERKTVDVNEKQLQVVISASDASILAETLRMISQ